MTEEKCVFLSPMTAKSSSFKNLSFIWTEETTQRKKTIRLSLNVFIEKTISSKLEKNL